MALENTELIKKEIKNHIAVLTLDNPPLNLLTPEVLTGLRETFEALGEDRDVRVIVLRANGKYFSGGADVGTFKNLPRGLNTVFGQRAIQAIENCPKATIIAIHGVAVGGGCEMAAAFDFRVMEESARIGVVESHIGITCAYGGDTRLPWLIGEQNAKYMLFSGDKIPAQKAKEMGLVLEVYPDGQLMEGTMKLAEHFAEVAPLSIKAAKTVMHSFREQLFYASFDREEAASRMCSSSEDAKEGWKAFKERRPPEFKGF